MHQSLCRSYQKGCDSMAQDLEFGLVNMPTDRTLIYNLALYKYLYLSLSIYGTVDEWVVGGLTAGWLITGLTGCAPWAGSLNS